MALPTKLLFHAFPRARYERDSGNRRVRWLPHTNADLDRGFAILDQILSHGILCTPERMEIYADPQSERPEKREALNKNQPYTSITQSRACFTLLGRNELSEATDPHPSHAQIFGPFAVGLDPMRARSLGICPVHYYYRHAHSCPDSSPSSEAVGGFGEQIVTRLTEMATVFSVLSRIETIARPDERWALPEEILDEVDIRPKFEARIESLLKTIDKRKAGDILAFFDTDRVAAWNIVDFVYMLLSLYQTTDSTLDGSPLTFFNQREWRLVFHTRHGLEWIGLGNHPLYRDPDAPRLAKNRRELTRFLLDDVTRRTPKDDYLRGCWALHTVDGAHFRNFVNELVVPPQYVDRAKALVSTYPFPAGAPVVYSAADV